MESGMMQKKTKFVKSILACLAITFGSSALAETTSSTFNIYLRGIKAGQLKYAYSESGSNYSASGIIQSTGIIGALAKYKFTASTSGTLSKGIYAPRAYREESDTGRRQSEKTISYSNGIPKVSERKLPKPFWADPAQQKGTVDPMTAISIVLNDKTESTVCQTNFDMFDGARRVQITVGSPSKSENGLTCKGLYKRVEGFSNRELSEGRNFPFSVTYVNKSGKYQVSEFDVSTLRGRARFVRQ